MAAHRFFLTAPVRDAETGAVDLPLSAEDIHHAVSVLRVRPGERIEVVEPGGSRVWTAQVVSVEADVVRAELLGLLEIAEHPRVTLVQGVAKGEKMDSIVRQAVEMGVDGVIPLLCERTIVRLDERKRHERGERWRRVAKAAAEQAHRDAVPFVRDPAPLAEVLEVLGGFDEVVVLWEEARGEGLQGLLQPTAPSESQRVAMVVGPEGGFSALEVDEFVRRGARVVTLGPSILRTETAALVALALVIWGRGGLGRGDA